MSVEDNALEERARLAGETLERSLMKAVGTVETELARVMRAGEADIERLAGAVVAILDRLNRPSVTDAGSTPRNDAGSTNEIATAAARAVRRGARFS